jgi:hypothetical protein
MTERWIRVPYRSQQQFHHSESDGAMNRSEPGCPPYHRSYPSGSKRKENATVKSGVLWRSFDFEEALRATNQYGTGKIPTNLPGYTFWTTAIDSSKTQKSRPILQPGAARGARHRASSAAPAGLGFSTASEHLYVAPKLYFNDLQELKFYACGEDVWRS